jgi:hypothetical protein
VPSRSGTPEAVAGAGPPEPTVPDDPAAASAVLEQGPMVHVFDTTTLPGGPWYVNDHTFVQARDGTWHLFGIFHAEPSGDDTEVDFIHAVATEADPERWGEGAFVAADPPYRIALRADASIGETHLWAPHIVVAEGRYWMVYQSGGSSDDRVGFRLAESDDLYRWSRLGDAPLFEDFCVARDPNLFFRDGLYNLYYTRCDSIARRTSGVAYRVSADLAHFGDPLMALTLTGTPPMKNSGFTESPFVFERGGYYYLSVTSYPIEWDATFLYRSPVPYSFPEVPYTRLRAHAGEWILVPGRAPLLSHAGPGQHGVWVSTVTGF